jgi:phosphoribosylglycinamide formyltransferase-1
MRILTPEFISGWQGKMLNIHPSLLPRHKGLHTHAKVLAAAEDEHGCTVHDVTAELDGGTILGQARMPVLKGDTAQSLAERLLPLEHQLYSAVLRRVSGGESTPMKLP